MLTGLKFPQVPEDIMGFLTNFLGGGGQKKNTLYEIDHVIVIKNFLNPEGHQNPIRCNVVSLSKFRHQHKECDVSTTQLG